MKKLIASVMALTLGASAAMAGGPVVVEEEGQPVVEEKAPRSGWIVPVIIGAIVICAIACGDDDESE
jgi:hypothetical protein